MSTDDRVSELIVAWRRKLLNHNQDIRDLRKAPRTLDNSARLRVLLTKRGQVDSHYSGCQKLLKEPNEDLKRLGYEASKKAYQAM